MSLIILLLIILSFLTTWIGVEIFRRKALQNNIVDVPNERSSHENPTPRGGGLIIVIVTLSLFALFCLYTRSLTFYLPFLFAGLLLSIVSLIDDIKDLTALSRFFIHFVCVGILIWFYGYAGIVYLKELTFSLGFFGLIVTLFYIVWTINAFNFMDGIDGLAGIEAFLVSVAWFILGFAYGETQIMVLGGLIASCCLGFLFHNWSPAKIFMGDVGSAFLGFIFSSMMLLTIENRHIFFVYSIIFLWIFLFDTVFTLFRRIFKGEKFWKAHKTHLYQRLIESGHSHSRASKIYAGLTLFILATAFILPSLMLGIFLTVVSTFLVFYVKRAENVKN